jgi:hypothetical protein
VGRHWLARITLNLKYDMTSSRTVKTLAYLVAAMTAVTLVLSLLEPWAASLRPHQALAGQEMLLAPLSAVRQTDWQTLELVLVPQEPGQTIRLPETHLIVHPDGRVETTAIYESARPLPDHVLRVCALYQGQPSDDLLRTWLTTCNGAKDHLGADLHGVRLKTMPQFHPSPSHTAVIGGIQRRINAMLRDR